MVVIEDGTGQGYKSKVNSDNSLSVEASTFDKIHLVNLDKGQAYGMTFTVTPTGANDCFCYIMNTSTNNLVLNSILLASASDEVIQMKLRDIGTPVGGSTAIPVNRNTNSNNTAVGTFQTGVDITGLSGGSIVDQYFVKGVTKSEKYSWASKIIIGPNGVFSLYAVTGAIALRISLSLFYEELVI